jgi:hypothetical protein
MPGCSMQSDFSVEMAREDAVLELPWKSEDGTLYYVDLKDDPARIDEIPELIDLPELKVFLLRVNRKDLPLQSVKCDAWFSSEIYPEEAIFEAKYKFSSYVDLVFTSSETRCSFEQHESFARKTCALLQKAPEIGSSSEFVVRRCYYPSHQSSGKDAISRNNCASGSESPCSADEGFSLTAYVSGFGMDRAEAHQRWAIGLQLVQHALVQAARSDF